MKDRIEAVLERSRILGIHNAANTKPRITTMEQIIDYSILQGMPQPRTMNDVLEISRLRGKLNLF